MKYPIIYTNKYIKKKLVGGLIPEDLKGINFFNKTSNAHEMLDPTNGFFFLKSDALLNYFRFGDDEYPITKVIKNKLIFNEQDGGIRPSNNFINKNTGITIEEIGKFLGIQYHNLYIKKLLEEYYEVELNNLETISDEIIKKLKGENNDKFEEINQSEKIDFDFNNFITDYNEIILKYKKIFIDNKKKQLNELKREINGVKNYLKINYINDKLKNLNLQGIFDRYFDEAKTYYQNNKNYFNLVKNNIIKYIQTLDYYFIKLNSIKKKAVEKQNSIILSKESDTKLETIIDNLTSKEFKKITVYNINDFKDYLKDNKISLEGFDEVVEPKILNYLIQLNSLIGLAVENPYIIDNLDPKKPIGDWPTIEVKLKHIFANKLTNEYYISEFFRFSNDKNFTIKGLEEIEEPEEVKIIKENLNIKEVIEEKAKEGINIDKDNEEVIGKKTNEKINVKEINVKEENDEDFNNFMNQFILEFFSLFLSIFWFKAEGKEDVYKYYDGVNSIFEQSRVILQNESDFPIIEVNQVTSSIHQNEQFQNELISKFRKFNSKINLENFTSSNYGDQSFPDCGETTLRNFVKIISMNIENEIDFNLLNRYGASDNLIKYFEIYKDALNNRSIIKPFSLDINNLDLSDKMLDGIILNTEEQQYLKNILDNSNTQDLFNIYQKNVEERPGSSVKRYYIFNNIDEFNIYLESFIGDINIHDNDNNYKYNSTDAWNLLVSNLEGIKYNPERKTCEIKFGLNDDGKLNILEVLKKLFSKEEFNSFKHFEIEGSISIDDSKLKDGFGEVKIKKNLGSLEHIYNVKLDLRHSFIEYETTDENNDYFSFEDCYSSINNKKECFYLKFITPYEANLFNDLEDILEIFNYNKFFYLYRKFTNNESIARTIQIKNFKNLIITKEKKNIYVNYFKYLMSLPNNNDLLKRMVFDCDYIDNFDELFKVDKNGEVTIAPQLINFNNFNFTRQVNKLTINKIHIKKYNQIDKISFPTSNLQLNKEERGFDVGDDQDPIRIINMDLSNIKILKIISMSSDNKRNLHLNFWMDNLGDIGIITEFYLEDFYMEKMPILPTSIEKLQIGLEYNNNLYRTELNHISRLNNLKELNLNIQTRNAPINNESVSILLKQKMISYLKSNNIVKCKFIIKTWPFHSDEDIFIEDYYYYPINYQELIAKLSNFNTIDQNEKNKLITSLKDVDQETINNYITILLNNFDNFDKESKTKLSNFNNINQNEKNELITSLKNVDQETIDNYITILLNNFGNIDEESKIKLMSYIKSN